jgi:hypothetical protein
LLLLLVDGYHMRRQKSSKKPVPPSDKFLLLVFYAFLGLRAKIRPSVSVPFLKDYLMAENQLFGGRTARYVFFIPAVFTAVRSQR